MNDRFPFKLRKPIVLITLIALVEIFTVIAYIDRLPQILTLSAITGFSVSFIFLRKDKAISIICAFMIILPALSSAAAFHTKTEPAKSIAESFGSDSETVYTAQIYDHTSYGKFCVSYAKITHINDKKTRHSIKARISSFGTDYLSENSSIKFKGVPSFISDIETEDFDTRFYLLGKSVFLDFKEADILSAEKSKSKDIFSLLRHKTKEIISKYLPYENNAKGDGVAYAMFSGDSECITDETKDAFSKSGTTHILCVSGMHLAILCSFLSAILKALTIPKNCRCLCIMAFCVLYTMFTGFALSTLRACIMCIINYICLIYGKKSDAYISLFISVYIITLINPFSLFDISLILSFLATLGLIAVSSVSPRIKRTNPLTSAVSIFFSGFMSGLGAVCFTLPFCAFFFTRTGIYSVISTLIISLPANLLLGCVFGLLLLSPLSFLFNAGFVLAPLGRICRYVSKFIVSIADGFSRLRFACIVSHHSDVFLIIHIVLLILLSIFVSFGKRKCSHAAVVLIVLLSAAQISTNLYYAIKDDSIYKVSYFRQNESDRQLSVKLGRNGYLLANADNRLCFDPELCPFDTSNGKNYLLIIPDKDINNNILAENIKSFEGRFGIKKVYIPDTRDGSDLFLTLTNSGIECSFIPAVMRFDSIHIKFGFEEYNSLFIDDGQVSTHIVFAENYDEKYFYAYADKNVFLTRKTKNQFNTEFDTFPKCSEFYARLGKGETYDNTVNIFGKKTVEIAR